jgi:hypothetical protein
LEGRRQVEHHHVRLVMSEDGGKTANRVRPGIEQSLDPDFFGIGEFRHSFAPLSVKGRAKEHEPDMGATKKIGVGATRGGARDRAHLDGSGRCGIPAAWDRRYQLQGVAHRLAHQGGVTTANGSRRRLAAVQRDAFN